MLFITSALYKRIYLFLFVRLLQREGVRERERNFFIHSCPNECQNSRSLDSIQVSKRVAEAQTFGPSFATFPDVLVVSWIGNDTIGLTPCQCWPSYRMFASYGFLVKRQSDKDRCQ